MANARARVEGAVDTARPYVERLAQDEELHDHVKRAYESARSIYDDLLGDRGTTGMALKVARDKDIQEELRKAVAAHVMARHDEGENLTSLAEALGLSLITLQRWAKRENVAIFRPVSVVEGRIEGRGRVVVHGPRGVRIEGLDAAGLAELLRRLG